MLVQFQLIAELLMDLLSQIELILVRQNLSVVAFFSRSVLNKLQHSFAS